MSQQAAAPSLSENPAVTNPRQALTRQQQDALCALHFFRFNSYRAGVWLVGNKRITPSVVGKLVAFRLLRKDGHHLSVTMAGELAIAKLKGEFS